jgi:hypothetical protein
MSAPYDLTNALIGLPEVKQALTIPQGDTADDYAISMAIDAASKEIEDATERRFYQDAAPSTRTFVAENMWEVQVDDFMTLAGLKIVADYAGAGDFTNGIQFALPTVVDGKTLEGGDVQLEPLNGLIRGQPWAFDHIRAIRSLYFPIWSTINWAQPYAQALVQVTAMWGWDHVPVGVRQAALLESISIYSMRNAPFGATAFGETGIVRAKPEMHPAAMKLIRPYMRESVLVG